MENALKNSPHEPIFIGIIDQSILQATTKKKVPDENLLA